MAEKEKKKEKRRRKIGRIALATDFFLQIVTPQTLALY